MLLFLWIFFYLFEIVYTSKCFKSINDIFIHLFEELFILVLQIGDCDAIMVPLARKLTEF